MADSAGFYRDLEIRGTRLMDGLRRAARESESNLRVHGLGSVFSTSFTTRTDIDDYREHAAYCDEDKYQLFRIAMLERGIRISANGRWHMASTHTDEDVERTVDAAKYALKSDRL